MSEDCPTVDDGPKPPRRLGRYEVRGLLGQGGFGRVYAGFDPQLQRPVAIKVPRMHGSEETAERFLVEAPSRSRAWPSRSSCSR